MTESLSFASEGRPFLNHEWAFDLALWAATHGDGDLVVAFKSVLSAGLFALSGLLAMRAGASPLACVLSVLAAIPMARSSLEARPHLVGFMLAAAFLLALDSLARGRRPRILVPAAIVAVWANVHGSFPLAFVLWGIAFASRVAGPREDRLRLLVALPAIALATCATPYGPGMWVVVFHHADPVYRVLVPEWGAVRFGESPAFDLSFLAVAGGVMLSFLPGQNRTRLRDLATAAAFVVPAVISVKFAAGMVVGASPVLAANVSRAWPRGRTRVLLAAGAVAAGAGVPFAPPHQAPGTGYDLSDMPAAAIDAALANGWTGRAFHPFDAGGYIEHAAHPTIRAFIDGRAYVHGREGLGAYLGALADPAGFAAINARWSFDLVIVDLLDPSFPRLTEALSTDRAFSLAWLDSRFAIFVPAGRAADPFRVLRPTTDPRYLLSLEAADLARGKEEAERVAASPAGEVMGRLARGVLALRAAGVRSLEARPPASGCDDALDDFARLVDLRPDVPMFRRLLDFARACSVQRAGPGS